MRVIALNGSPRKDGNTAAALKIMAEELEKEGIAVETVNIGHAAIAQLQKTTNVFLKMTLSTRRPQRFARRMGSYLPPPLITRV